MALEETDCDVWNRGSSEACSEASRDPGGPSEASSRSGDLKHEEEQGQLTCMGVTVQLS